MYSTFYLLVYVESGMTLANRSRDGVGEKATDVPISMTFSESAVYTYTVELNLTEPGFLTLSYPSCSSIVDPAGIVSSTRLLTAMVSFLAETLHSMFLPIGNVAVVTEQLVLLIGSN